ncbi:MAG: WYL domain-containing protein [Gemmatimonadota bacterium]|nr:WYL domain-containing protein [Gemmatimonadota bacterium]
MPDRISKLQRWLDLISFLAARHFPVTVDQIWQAVPAYTRGLEADPRTQESVRRAFERDKSELRAAGIPIDTVSYSVNQAEPTQGYRLATRDFHLPYLRLVGEMAGAAGPAAPASTEFTVEESEVAAALEGLGALAELPGFPLATEARSAYRKLAFDLDPLPDVEAPVLYAPDPEAEGIADTLRALSDALLERRRVTFRYHAMHSDEESQRSARPYGLVFQHGRWYLVGWAEEREALRMFRVGRMTEVVVEAKAEAYDIPADFDLGTFAGRSAWELGDDPEGSVSATVAFRFPRSVWAERNGHGTRVDGLEDGGELRRFDVHRRDPFLRWVLSLAGDARVVDPPDLRDAFRALAGAARERYAVDPEPRP